MAWDLWHLARASGDTTLARPHAEPFSSSINPIAFSDVQRYVLGANIIEHVTNSNTVKNVLQVRYSYGRLGDEHQLTHLANGDIHGQYMGIQWPLRCCCHLHTRIKVAQLWRPF